MAVMAVYPAILGTLLKKGRRRSAITRKESNGRKKIPQTSQWY
jgi:hypothetical protein